MSAERLNRIGSRFLWPLAILCLSVALFQSVNANASRPTIMQAAPTAVAVIDVGRLTDEIDEAGEWDMKLEALQSSMNSEGQEAQAAMERRLKESEETEDLEKRQEIRDEVALMQLQLEQWAKFKGQELDRERSLKWQSIYRNLRREAQKVAEADGYELVLVNDSAGEIRTQAGAQASMEQQVLTQILNRRILYSGSTIDITDQVIVRMNNAQ
jgi:Skp family chaperone for outer membrane proteins